MRAPRARSLRALAITVSAVLVALVADAPGALAQGPDEDALQDPVQEAIRTRLEAPEAPAAAGEPLLATTALPAFYERRGYRPAWLEAGAPRSAARRLVREIARAGEEGLRPADYHLTAIRDLLGELDRRPRMARPAAAADLELLLSDAFLVLGSHYLSGRVDPTAIHSEWVANRRSTDMATVLETALAAGEPAAALQALLPQQPGYARLREALARYRAVDAAGGWPSIPPGATLHPGDTGARVAALQARLLAGGDLAASDVAGGDLAEGGEPDTLAAGGGPDSLAAGDSVVVFGPATEAAVRRFQARHGMDADGVVGAGTLAALNEPVSARIQRLVLNMERWRWLPAELGARYILVNIASFELAVVESGREVMTMRVAVGRPFRKTPVFSDRMTHLVLSPYWHVPTNLAVRDKLPEIRRQGVGWFARNHMKVFRGWGTTATEVDPATVDWTRLSAASFPYRLRQDPGPWNALGRVKFMFPNRFNVYLHDTPGREIFAATERAFSSGCIRIEKPMELALYLIGDQGWTAREIQEVVDARVERTVPIADPLPVHLLYWTAWADPDGTLNFRRDLYDRDPPLSAALAERPPRLRR